MVQELRRTGKSSLSAGIICYVNRKPLILTPERVQHTREHEVNADNISAALEYFRPVMSDIIVVYDDLSDCAMIGTSNLTVAPKITLDDEVTFGKRILRSSFSRVVKKGIPTVSPVLKVVFLPKKKHYELVTAFWCHPKIDKLVSTRSYKFWLEHALIVKTGYTDVRTMTMREANRINGRNSEFYFPDK